MINKLKRFVLTESGNIVNSWWEIDEYGDGKVTKDYRYFDGYPNEDSDEFGVQFEKRLTKKDIKRANKIVKEKRREQYVYGHYLCFDRVIATSNSVKELKLYYKLYKYHSDLVNERKKERLDYLKRKYKNEKKR